VICSYKNNTFDDPNLMGLIYCWVTIISVYFLSVMIPVVTD